MAFEPNDFAFKFLEENVSGSQYTNIIASPLALGAAEETRFIGPAVNGNAGHTQLAIAAQNSKDRSVLVRPLDAFDIAKVDFIKADVEGMENSILEGAANLINTSRPIIFVESNTLEDSVPVLQWASGTDYLVFGIITPAFNHDNFNRAADNMFGPAKETGLLLIGRERLAACDENIRTLNISKIETVDDLALLLLHKPQYPYEVLDKSLAAKTLGLTYPAPMLQAAQDLAQQRQTTIEALHRELSTAEETVKTAQKLAQEQQVSINGLERLVRERQASISELEQLVKERQASINELEQLVKERQASINELEQLVKERQAATDELKKMHAKAERAKQEAQDLAKERQATIDEIFASTSWRSTAPLRWTKESALLATRLAGESLNRSRAMARFQTAQIARLVYRRLPVSHRTRLRIKDLIFSHFGFPLRGTASYRHWASQWAIGSAAVTVPAVDHTKPESNGSTWRDSYLELSAFSRRVQHERIHGFEPKPVPTIVLSEQDAVARARALAFSPSRKPKVSIVIPVYGKFRLTIECLCSLLEAKNAVPFEVIIVDDGSTEDSCDRLADIAGVKYVRNATNLGFVKTCNRGVEHAVGEYVVVLNNDVQVTDSWLDELIAAIEAGPDIGAVGPKIMYPNGRLQEAGVVINRDGTSTLVGVAEQGDLPAYNYRREVDYCSGACLVFKKALFDELGGFDLEFAPSYCEDVDLCLKIRQQGLKIIYVPESVVVHHLSATANAVHKSYKGWMIVHNQQKLAERRQAQIDQLNEVRLIAFYLPQFHPIPENDRWWGKGFTEWNNVAKARPNFVGHQQPIIPADLGFYDLRLTETMVAQAALARRYGVHGFCFYYYWFDGKRLLEAPLEQMLETGKPDIPFCLCWANENWTRRWDGRNSDILMQQNHTEADDYAVIDDVARYMRHPNYIRVQGKPVFAVYQVGEFPDIVTTASRWRQRCRDHGLGDIFLVRVDSQDAAFRNVDPRSFGFDAAVEFPPHAAGTLVETPPLVNEAFQGHVYDYAQMVKTFIRRTLPGYPMFRCVTPRWDNTARKQNHSDVFIGANPGAYQAWLQAMIEQTRLMHHGDARIVFINAWNEWAEGAHLEPDRIFGHSYLQATRDALDAGVLARVKENLT